MSEFLRRYAHRVEREGYKDEADQISSLADKLESEGFPRDLNVKLETALQRVTRLLAREASNFPDDTSINKLLYWHEITSCDDHYLLGWKSMMEELASKEVQQVTRAMGVVRRRLDAKTLGDLGGKTPDELKKIRGIGDDLAEFLVSTFDLASRKSS